MQADATLTGADRKIVIETKCATQMWQIHYERRSVRSEHLYQLFAYLQNGEAAGPLDRDATGLLLYAGDTEAIDVRTTIRGHRVHVRSLRLSQPWEQVSRDLLAIVDDAARG